MSQQVHPAPAQITGLYTVEQRQRRDESVWTLVQGVLAPLQFFVFLISLVMVLRFLHTGQGYEIATLSIVIKTLVLYLIMVTGALWEHDVFGQYLFAHSFFWEDMVSMLVIALHTAYLASLTFDLLSQSQLMWLALAAYATYVINAGQFLYKFRLARASRSPKHLSADDRLAETVKLGGAAH